MSENFEMANVNDPMDIIKATHISAMKGLIGLFQGLKEDMNQPGLTWSQIEDVLNEFSKKEPTVIFQKEEM